jgi:hypothetical protein
MKDKYCKTKFSTIALILVLVISAILVTLPAVTAHDPPIEIQTYPFLAITPNPVGVGQTVYLIMWIHGVPPTAAGVGGDRYHDYTIEVIKPDGSTESLGPWVSDPTGSYFTAYMPNQVGTYEFVFSYDGQVVSLYHPVTGIEGNPSEFLGDTLLPSTTTTILTVQEDQVVGVPDYPLPTEYWERPIEGQNTAWASIASNWLRGGQIATYYGYSQDLFQQDGNAPNTPHIVWTKPIEFGGVVGGTTEIPGVTYYTGGAYEGRFTDAIIMQGRVYFHLPLNHAGGSRATSGGYMCVDLRTGEEYWISEEIGIPYTGVYGRSDRPTMKGQLFDYESMNQHGVVGGTIWYVAGNTWIAYDGFTGQWIYNLTNVPSGYEVYTNKGEILRYALNYNERWLALWNNTQDNVGLHAAIGTSSEAYQWRPMGKTVDMSTAYSWNVTIPDLPGLSNPSIIIAYPGDLILGTSSSWPSLGGYLIEMDDPWTMWAISDKPETRGQLLWIKNYTAPTNDITLSLGPVDQEKRVFTVSETQTMQWLGYSLDTGELLWGPTDENFNAFQYYASGEGAGQKGFAAYGNFYTQGYGGQIHCFDISNGNLLWEYNNTISGTETIWGNYPIFISAIADGKVYAFNNEHSPNVPHYKGYRVRCIDAFTGEELWTLLGWAGQTGGRGYATSIVADGYLVYYNYYDSQIYSVGKGPSATTVSVQDNCIQKGENILITGTVTDESGGTKQSEQAIRFPNGVPAVSDESMAEWMEYVYMQKPCPEDVTGVQVKLTAVGPNGNTVDIGTVTSDGYGMFKKMWTPDSEGEYTIVATFEGSESYWTSYAETAIGVGPAPSPEQPIEPEPEPEAPLITTEIAIVLAVVAVAVIGVVSYWVLKKRQ